MKQEQLWHEVIVQSQLMKSKLHTILAQIAAAYDLTAHQMLVLLAVQKSNVMSIGEISKSLEIFQANASSLCKRMESLGYVDRIRNAGDVRVVNIQLTSKGESIAEQLKEEIAQRLCRVRSENVSITAIQQGLAELCKVIQIMEESI